MGMCKECGVVFPSQDMKNGYCKEHVKENNDLQTQTNNGIEVENIGKNAVVITDIKMPFLSMVIFMVKWVIASIPAFIILVILEALTTGLLTGLISGISR